MNQLLKKRIVRFGVWFLLAVPVLVLGLATAEFTLRFSRSRSFVTYQPCMRRAEGDAFLSYVANCSSTQSTEHGTVAYHFNELGLRDRPEAVFEGGAVLALGDSITKGLYLDENETIPRLLEKSLAGTMKYPVLNAGVRYASPTTESLLYRRLRRKILIKAVIWFLNGTDTIDERFYRAMATKTDSEGVPLSFSVFYPVSATQPGLLERLYRFCRGQSYLMELIRQHFYYRRYVELAKSVPPEKNVLCNAIFRLAANLKSDGVPLLTVFTPLPRKGIERIWPGMTFEPADLAQMVACAESTGSPVIDLSRTEPRESWYVADNLHPTPEGARWIVDHVAPRAAELLKGLR